MPLAPHPLAHPVVAAALAQYRTLTPERAAVSTESTATLADEAPADATEPAPDSETLPNTWEGVIGVEGERTGDGRLIEANALRWDITPEAPLPFRMVSEDVGAHDGAVIAGRILTIERRDGGQIWGTGDFDLGSTYGVEARRLVHEGLQAGVSMDLDDVSFEVRVASDLLADDSDEGEDVPVDAILADGADSTDVGGNPNAPEAATRAEDGSDHEPLFGMRSDDELMVTTDARIRAATLVAVPAFASARIALVDAPAEAPAADGEDAEAIIAAAAPVEPPAEWFTPPAVTGPTALTVTPEGRVYGHLATWDVCHIASPNGAGVCVQAPHSSDGYATFHTGAVRTREGTTVPTGRLTMSTGHATPQMSAATAANHYDHTGTAVADVRATEDAYGIMLAGALRPRVTPEQVRTLRASPLSGDWREIRQGLGRLVGALAVNVPGFPIPRPTGLVASGEMQTLVAAGMLPPRRVRRPGTPGALSAGDLKYLKMLANRERGQQRIELRARVDKAKVAAFAHRRAVTAATATTSKGA